MAIPHGYEIYETGEDYIKILAVNFMLFCEDAPETFEYACKTYKRGMIEVMPKHLENYACSLRNYNLVE